MLVVWDVQPGSPSDGILEPGDMLVRVNGALVTRFEPLEAVLDDSVGGNVELQLQRGGKLYTAKLKVEDLDCHHAGLVPGIRRCRGAYAVLPGGARVSPPRCAACSSPPRAISSMPQACRAARSSPS